MSQGMACCCLAPPALVYKEVTQWAMEAGSRYNPVHLQVVAHFPQLLHDQVINGDACISKSRVRVEELGVLGLRVDAYCPVGAAGQTDVLLECWHLIKPVEALVPE